MFGIGDEEAGDQREADQAADIARGPAEARTSVPSRFSETSDTIMALVKTVASSAPMVARPKAMQHQRRTRSVRPGAASHRPNSPTTSSTEKKAIQGLRFWLASAMAPSTGASAAAISSAMPVA